MKRLFWSSLIIGTGAYVLMNWSALVTFVGVMRSVGPGFGP
jgi:hypothetical protein